MTSINERAWSECYSNEDAEKMGLGYNRDAAAKKNCISRGFAGATGEFRDCGSWKFSLMCQNPDWHNSGPHDGWKDDGCIDKTHRYARQVDAKGLDWDRAAQWLFDRLPSTFQGKQVVKKDMDTGSGKWVRVYVKDNICDPSMQDSAGSNSGSGTVPFDIKSTAPCFSRVDSVYGRMHANVMEPMTTDTVFTLEARNWISGKKGYKTFLKAVGDALRTDDSVLMTGRPLNNAYTFRFRKDNCNSNSDKYILYGNTVQLYCVGTNRYVQCGAGTCSTVVNSGDCKSDSWQTFTIESPTGKQGRVCFSDDVYIRQTTGDKPAITPAGATHVWAQRPEINEQKNNVLTIQGINGSIYVDPFSEMKNYEMTRCDELCSKDPWNALCVVGECSSVQKFWQQNKSIVYMVVFVMILCSATLSAIRIAF